MTEAKKITALYTWRQEYDKAYLSINIDNLPTCDLDFPSLEEFVPKIR